MMKNESTHAFLFKQGSRRYTEVSGLPADYFWSLCTYLLNIFRLLLNNYTKVQISDYKVKQELQKQYPLCCLNVTVFIN